MADDKQSEIGSVWLQSKMEWNHVQRVKARIAGSTDTAPRQIGGLELTHISRQFIAWWLEARGSAPMPTPEQIDHKALVELLPYFRMLRWESEDSLVFRLLGTVIVEVAGADFTGLDVFADRMQPGFESELERCKLVHAQPCGLLVRRSMPRRDGSVGAVEVLSLPVSADGEGKTRIVGTVAVCEQWTDPVAAIQMAEPIDPVPSLQHAVFFDLGFGLPEAAARLSV